jgi:CheY-like chemotaxis protein
MDPSGDVARPLSFLVVDDLADAAASTAMLLSLHGYAARVAGSGEEALRAVAADPPDVVLIDLVMPGMGGLELARQLRAMNGRRPFLVAVSGRGTDEDRQRSAAAGIDLHLVKPVDPAALIRAVEQAAGGRP